LFVNAWPWLSPKLQSKGMKLDTRTVIVAITIIMIVTASLAGAWVFAAYFGAWFKAF
jgi:hypothetical protein